MVLHGFDGSCLPGWFLPIFGLSNWLHGEIPPITEYPHGDLKLSTGFPMVCHLPKRSDLAVAKVTVGSIRFHHKLYGTKFHTPRIDPDQEISRRVFERFLPAILGGSGCPGWVHRAFWMDPSDHQSFLAIPKVSLDIPMVCHLQKRSDLAVAKVTDDSIRFHHKLYGTEFHTPVD